MGNDWTKLPDRYFRVIPERRGGSREGTWLSLDLTIDRFFLLLMDPIT